MVFHVVLSHIYSMFNAKNKACLYYLVFVGRGQQAAVNLTCAAQVCHMKF